MKIFTRTMCEFLDFLHRYKVLEDNFKWLMGLGYYLLFLIRNNIKVVGLHRLPRNKNFLLVGNHSSVADAYLLFALFFGRLRMPFWYITKVSDEEKKSPLQTRLLRLTNAMPRVGKGDALVNWMIKCLVDPGRRRVAIPPEGMYNEDGRLMKGFTGVVRVYYGANKHHRIPILPIVSIGAAEAYPTKPDPDGKFRPRKHKGIIGVIGAPFHLAKEPAGGLSSEFLRQQLDVVMERMRRLMRQEEPIEENWKLDQVRSSQKGTSRAY